MCQSKQSRCRLGDPLLQHKQPYLNVPFFLVRAGLFFAVWALLTSGAVRRSHALDRTRTPLLRRRLQRFSALGLVLIGLTATFAAIDWLMSLEPHWYSTIYGALIAMGAVLAAFAFSLLVVGLLRRQHPLAQALTPRLYNDFGSLLLAFVMLWAYLALMQYLVVWSANLSEEVTWYLPRLRGIWQAAILGVIVFNFALPFVLLLSRTLKRSPRGLMAVAALVLLMRFVDVYWLIAPSFHQPAFAFSWVDASLAVGLGGLWLAEFLRRLGHQALLPRTDPRFQPGAESEPAQS